MVYGKLIEVLRILNIYKNSKLPQKLCYAITRNFIALNKEYNIYTEMIKKIFGSFEEYFMKDDNGNPVVNNNGIPVIEDIEISKEMNSQIIELLNTEVEVDLHMIDFDMFDYDDKGIYDVLSMDSIIELSSVMCVECMEN